MENVSPCVRVADAYAEFAVYDSHVDATMRPRDGGMPIATSPWCAPVPVKFRLVCRMCYMVLMTHEAFSE
jgi:hypothetical protein